MTVVRLIVGLLDGPLDLELGEEREARSTPTYTGIYLLPSPRGRDERSRKRHCVTSL